MIPNKFFDERQQADITTAIQEAELNTSGEIRVHIENELTGDALDRAAYIFKKLGIQNTKERNGILFYLAFGSKKYAILGDAGINEKVDRIRDGRSIPGLSHNSLRSDGQDGTREQRH